MAMASSRPCRDHEKCRESPRRHTVITGSDGQTGSLWLSDNDVLALFVIDTLRRSLSEWTGAVGMPSRSPVVSDSYRFIPDLPGVRWSGFQSNRYVFAWAELANPT